MNLLDIMKAAQTFKPCPFCGGVAQLNQTVECGARTRSCGYDETEQDAIDAWNERV